MWPGTWWHHGSVLVALRRRSRIIHVGDAVGSYISFIASTGHATLGPADLSLRARGAIIARSARFSARSLHALGGGYGSDDSLALGVGAVASTF